MRILTLLSIGALAAPLAAQTALNETFSYSSTLTFPPTGWSNVNNNGGQWPGWEEVAIQTNSTQATFLTADAAVHDDQLSGSTNDYTLITPTLDLAAYGTPQLNFLSELYYAAWMANNPSPNGDGVSTIELSTDGGATWTVEWTDVNTVNGVYPTTVDLAGYSGQAAVELGFRYYGTYAHGWVVDDAIVDNGGAPVGPGLSVSGTCPGVQNANASGMTAGGPVAFYYALAAGSTTIPSGGCAGLTLPVAAPTQLGGFVIADAAGNASLSGSSQPSHCGLVILGAVDVATCTGSNTVTL